MSAAKSLSHQFYHGSYEKLAVGDVIVPGAERDVQNFPSGENTMVYLTTRPFNTSERPSTDVYSHTAADWASEAAHQANKKDIYVYEVEPHTPPVQTEGVPGYQTTAATIKNVQYSGPRKRK